MAMGTLCTGKKPLVYGDGDNLHWQKAPHIWQWGHFALAKSPSKMVMGTHLPLFVRFAVCTGIYLYVHLAKDGPASAPQVCSLDALPWPPTPLGGGGGVCPSGGGGGSYMAMGTLCTSKKPLICANGNTLHRQKAPHIWRWGHFALPKSPSHTATGTLCTAKKPLIYGAGDTLNCQKAPHIWRWGHFALPKPPHTGLRGRASKLVHINSDPYLKFYSRDKAEVSDANNVSICTSLLPPPPPL